MVWGSGMFLVKGAIGGKFAVDPNCCCRCCADTPCSNCDALIASLGWEDQEEDTDYDYDDHFLELHGGATLLKFTSKGQDDFGNSYYDIECSDAGALYCKSIYGAALGGHTLYVYKNGSKCFSNTTYASDCWECSLETGDALRFRLEANLADWFHDELTSDAAGSDHVTCTTTFA